MTTTETATLRIRDQEIQVPKAKIREFADYLSSQPAYQPENVDTHISFMYSGNIIAVQEFLDWYELNK